MSITDYLLQNLKGPITLYVSDYSFGLVPKTLKFKDIRPRLSHIDGNRHAHLPEVAHVLATRGRPLSSFKVIFAAIRNPYDLEVSHFHRMKSRTELGLPGKSKARQIVAGGDFELFAEEAPYYGFLPSNIERYYSIDGETPPNMRLIRFENLNDEVERLIEPHSYGRAQMGHRNKSERNSDFRTYFTPRSEQAIYAKYRFLFDFYDREKISPDTR